MHNTGRTLTAALAAAAIGLLAAGCGSSGTTTAAGTATTAAGGTTAAAAATSAGPTGAAQGTTSAPSAGAAGSTGGVPTSPGTATGTPANYPVDLQPSTAAPGSRVMVYGMTCSATTGTAVSSAFTAKVALSTLSDATGGAATVKPGLAAGKYPVTVSCGDITVTGTLTVS